MGAVEERSVVYVKSGQDKFTMHINITRDGGGWIKSDLKEMCDDCGEENCIHANLSRSIYNSMMDAIESLVLAHACAGVDITSKAYVEGIDTAVEACANSPAFE